MIGSAMRIAFMIALSIGIAGCLEPFEHGPYNHDLNSNYPGLCRLGHRPGGDSSSYWCDRAR
jgi:hypothetical protein